MDNSGDGAVLLSMGSVANSTLMPHELKMAFLKAFANFPSYTFIWKYEDDSLPAAKDFKNVHLSNWVPQMDLFGMVGHHSEGGGGPTPVDLLIPEFFLGQKQCLQGIPSPRKILSIKVWV